METQLRVVVVDIGAAAAVTTVVQAAAAEVAISATHVYRLRFRLVLFPRQQVSQVFHVVRIRTRTTSPTHSRTDLAVRVVRTHRHITRDS